MNMVKIVELQELAKLSSYNKARIRLMSRAVLISCFHLKSSIYIKLGPVMLAHLR